MPRPSRLRRRAGEKLRRGWPESRGLWRHTREVALEAESEPIEFMRTCVSSKAQELETAKEILAEVFGAPEKSWTESVKKGLVSHSR